MAFSIVIAAVIGVAGYLVKYWTDQRTQAITKKREVYEGIALTMGVFVIGKVHTSDDKQKFLENTSKMWLWASDSVIRECNKFVDIMIRFKGSEQEEQRKAKRAYASFIIEMRKDLGFPKTKLSFDDYRFVTFGRQ